MKMITFQGGRSLKLLHAFLMLLVPLRPSLGFISEVGAGHASNINCLEGERQALVEFKKGLVDDSGRLSWWGRKKNCCDWEGVHCSNQTSHVLELKLDNYGLQGMISPSLLELPYLTFLDLSGNDFNRSHIPKSIGSLSSLKHLNLYDANFSGPIPYQLGNLLSLQYLDLHGNDFIIIENLQWLSHLSSIENLDLSSTNLSVVNNWLEVVSHLPNLKSLNMSNCNLPPMSLSYFSHIDYLKSFTSLEILELQGNQLKGGIPKFWGDICTLNKLDLSENNLNVKLVDVINNLSGCAKDSLEVLDLSGNQLTGSLPNFAIFPSLKEIYLRSNNINGTVPRSIGNLTKLEYLDISSNSFRGVISEDHFSNLSKLQFLFLFNNSLALEVSLNRIPPFQLDSLYLSSCKLGPRFPNWIRTQRKVSILGISHTNISDTIPADWFADLPHTLEFLDLSSNQMHGRLPKVSTKRLNNGLAIILSDNSIKGPLPLFSTNLTSLNLSKNQFSGSISSICKINGRSLTYLDLSDNLLSGRLPHDCFMHWGELVVLNLAGNNFFGEVPSSLGSLSKLETLMLNNNNFSGDVPSSMKNCSSLKVIELGDNKFSGKVPEWIGEGLPNLIVLILRSNKLDGSIPLNLCWLKNLQILDLSLNDISGTIPHCINNFTAMAQKGDSSNYIIYSICPISSHNNISYGIQYVDSATVVSKGREDEYRELLGLLKVINLSNNKLTGKLPIEISSLLELYTLNVSRNNLIGEIPHLIGQLKQLETLDLSRNQFIGEIPLSMSELTFLSHLNVSYNHLSGKIPSSTQLQGFKAYDFAGNPGLCGLPLSQKCWTSEQTPNQSEDGEEYRDEFWKCFYGAAGFGFVVVIFGVCGSLLLKDSWRHAYFLSLENMKDCLYVTMAVNMARLWRTFQRPG